MMHGLVVKSLSAPAEITASGAAALQVNVTDLHSLAMIHLSAGPTNAGTLTVKLQHSDNGTDWVDVPNGAFPATNTSATQQTLLVNVDRFRKFLRVFDTLAGGATSVTRSVTIAAQQVRS